jgi:cytochrome c oxidase subunit 2
LFAQYDFPKADLTITATGSNGIGPTNIRIRHHLRFTIMHARLKEGQPRLLTVDREVVVPVNRTSSLP